MGSIRGATRAMRCRPKSSSFKTLLGPRCRTPASSFSGFCRGLRATATPHRCRRHARGQAPRPSSRPRLLSSPSRSHWTLPKATATASTVATARRTARRATTSRPTKSSLATTRPRPQKAASGSRAKTKCTQTGRSHCARPSSRTSRAPWPNRCCWPGCSCWRSVSSRSRSPRSPAEAGPWLSSTWRPAASSQTSCRRPRLQSSRTCRCSSSRSCLALRGSL
mmetsp:Transcript_28614/g.65918  ORF Transcript_28614/g.65918 Transcript_28614/m.65918 type:complete len:222 (+) Transcript_28614:3641-4306(+)